MTYRNDLQALRTRYLWLEQELVQLDTSTGELATRRALLVRELDAARAQLAGHPSALQGSPLDSVRIASPCKADWNEMAGDDRVRFCGTCAKNVYNLSAMTREEAERLLVQTEGRVCARLYRRTDGTVLTTDCPVGEERKAVRRLALVTAGSTALVAASLVARASLLEALPGELRSKNEPAPAYAAREPEVVPRAPLSGSAVPARPAPPVGRFLTGVVSLQPFEQHPTPEELGRLAERELEATMSQAGVGTKGRF
jgi:hypothetical protein